MVWTQRVGASQSSLKTRRTQLHGLIKGLILDKLRTAVKNPEKLAGLKTGWQITGVRQVWLPPLVRQT